MKNKTDNKFKVQISSIISGIAVLISLSSLLYQVNINSKAIENQNTKEKRSQAINVSMWYKTITPISRDDKNIIINNANSNAIYDVFVIYVSNRSPGKLSDIGLITQYGDNLRNNCQFIEVLPPGETKLVMNLPRAMGGEHATPEIFFTDSNGKSWFRNLHGKLLESKSLNQLLPEYKIPAPYTQYSPT